MAQRHSTLVTRLLEIAQGAAVFLSSCPPPPLLLAATERKSPRTHCAWLVEEGRVVYLGFVLTR